jgi:hypothetical protein
MQSYTGKIEEYQRAMLYSFQYETGKDAPVRILSDVQAFFDTAPMWLTISEKSCPIIPIDTLILTVPRT